MRWQEESSRPAAVFDYSHSMEIIADAYHEGYINWVVYKKAQEKAIANSKGGWMFEQGVNRETNLPIKGC